MNLKVAGLVCISLLTLGVTSSFADMVNLINSSTPGYYNASIGELLNGTNPYNGSYLFPNNNSNPNDPLFLPVTPEPDLSAASSVLGTWLETPQSLNGNWTNGSIPADWAINSETAIVYQFSGGSDALENVVATFGVDNGIFIWLDGDYKFGALAPGGASPNEYTLNLGNLSTGTHYLQVLREDHGGSTGYYMSVSGNTIPASSVPEPGIMSLLGVTLLGLGLLAKKS